MFTFTQLVIPKQGKGFVHGPGASWTGWELILHPSDRLVVLLGRSTQLWFKGISLAAQVCFPDANVQLIGCKEADSQWGLYFYYCITTSNNNTPLSSETFDLNQFNQILKRKKNIAF